MGKQKHSQEKKVEILQEAEESGFLETADKYEMHFTTLYDWRRKLDKAGKEGLPNKSGGHNQGKRCIEEWKIKEVLKEKKENPGYGPSQLRNQLRRRGITISILSIEQILKDKGCSGKKKSEPKKITRFEAAHPLELVQIDIMEFYIHKARVYLVFLLDDYSRFILNFSLTDASSMEGIIGMVKESIQRYGKMEKLLSDRGFVFHSWKGVNRFEKYLEEMGVYHIHTSAHHPQTIGKVERVNQSVQKELLRVKEFKDVEEGRKEIEKWIWRYNYKRVHQGLGGILVPADRFHGWSGEISKSLSKLVEDGIELSDREITVFQIKQIRGKVEIWALGKKVTMDSRMEEER